MKELKGRQDNTRGLEVTGVANGLQIKDSLFLDFITIKKDPTLSVTEQMCKILDRFSYVKYYSILLDSRKDTPMLFVCTPYFGFSVEDLAEVVELI